MSHLRFLGVLVALLGVAACGTDGTSGDDDAQGDHDNVGPDNDFTNQGDSQGGDGLLQGDSAAGDGNGSNGDNDGSGDTDGGDGGDGTATGDDGPGPGDNDPQTPVATTLVAVSNASVSALAGTAVTAIPEVEVRDQFGMGMPGIAVHFALTAGGGVIAPTTDLTTDANGRAKLTSWTLGKSKVTNTVVASLPALPTLGTKTFTGTITSGYDITIVVLGTMTDSQLAGFESAAARWEAVITNDLADFPVFNPGSIPANSLCGAAANAGLPSNIPIDDLVIFARVGPIDGENQVLAEAGPCFGRDGGAGSPAVGIMNFDEADIVALETRELFDDVILHEMGHVLGIGTFWAPLIENPSSPNCSDPEDPGQPGVDTKFTGAYAAGVFPDLHSPVTASYPGSVPADNSASCGSADSHWRENVFGIELMSPSIDGVQTSMPMSIVTVASLADLGFYQANGAAADPFDLAPGLRVGPPPREIGHCGAVSPTEAIPLPNGLGLLR